MNENKCNVEVFARVTGFFRPVQSWNKGKAEEFKYRKKFNIAAVEPEMEDADSRVTESVTG